MTDPEMISVIKILDSLGTAAFLGAPDMFPLLVLKSVNIHLIYGNGPLAAYAYVGYGAILTAGLGDVEGGYRFGNLAFKIMDKYNARELESPVIFTYNILIRHWKEHIKKSMAAGMEGYQIGIETGRLEFAALKW
jgi:predicted ATPase